MGDSGDSKAKAELFVLSGADVGRSFELTHGSTVGRAPDRTVALRDRSISRHHAHFEFSDGSWSIVDDGSTNGFVVDGVRSERARLSDLGEFLIGEVLVRVRTELAAAPSAPAAAPLVRPSPPPPVAAVEIEIEDEILLDSEPEATRTTIARMPPPAAPVAPVLSAPSPAAAARAAADPGFAARGRRVLQYHKQEARSGLLVTDLAQRPLWVRALVFAAVLALTGALAWGVYRGVLSMREDVAGKSAP